MKKKSANKLCFVIGPIGKHNSEDRTHADTLLKRIIKPTFAKHFKNFTVERADQIARPGMIDSQVITHLIEADLVVADLTGRNANAFYELGIRHMLQKPVIHLYRRGDTIPADIAPYRAVEFSYLDKWEVRDAKIALRKTVSQVLLPNFYIENPVTRSAGFVRLQNAAAPNVKRADPSRKKKRRYKVEVPGSLILENAPGIEWQRTSKGWRAVWRAPERIVKAGWKPASINLWLGAPGALSQVTKQFISDRANAFQTEMYQWDADHS